MSNIYVTMGRAFKVVAQFPDTEEGARAANAHMEENHSVGVIATENGFVKLAALADKGIRLDPLECCCCGKNAGRFVQWHNRDTGYGLCPDCIDHCKRGATEEEFRSAYCRGNAIKYAWRTGKKGDYKQDMAKSGWYSARIAA